MKTLLQAFVDHVYEIDADLNLHPACPLPACVQIARLPVVPALARIQLELEAMDRELRHAEALAAKFGAPCCTETRRAA
ncbi:MAG TPA: hypothetical protein VK968_12780 [Roseimicrobium sp.]|nr:hypothetical protein [Roseimicrobium sp.]